jgi:hypothetical protein
MVTALLLILIAHASSAKSEPKSPENLVSEIVLR